MSDDLLKQGIAALKAGRKIESRRLLLQVVEQDECNEMAWLWLSGAVDEDKERIFCLQKVLTVNPHNKVAQRGIEMLQKRSSQIADSTPATELPEAKSAAQPGAKIREGIKPTLREESKRNGPGWKWLLLGGGGAAILLLGGCFMAYNWGSFNCQASQRLKACRNGSIDQKLCHTIAFV